MSLKKRLFILGRSFLLFGIMPSHFCTESSFRNAVILGCDLLCPKNYIALSHSTEEELAQEDHAKTWGLREFWFNSQRGVVANWLRPFRETPEGYALCQLHVSAQPLDQLANVAFGYRQITWRHHPFYAPMLWSGGIVAQLTRISEAEVGVEWQCHRIKIMRSLPVKQIYSEINTMGSGERLIFSRQFFEVGNTAATLVLFENLLGCFLRYGEWQRHRGDRWESQKGCFKPLLNRLPEVGVRIFLFSGIILEFSNCAWSIKVQSSWAEDHTLHCSTENSFRSYDSIFQEMVLLSRTSLDPETARKFEARYNKNYWGCLKETSLAAFRFSTALIEADCARNSRSYVSVTNYQPNYIQNSFQGNTQLLSGAHS